MNGMTLDKLDELVKKFPAFTGSRRFIPVFRKSHQLPLCYASYTQSTLFRYLFPIILICRESCHCMFSYLLSVG